VSLSSERNIDINIVNCTGCTISQETNKDASTETEDNISPHHQYSYAERG
jgi:hypothetical protein